MEINSTLYLTIAIIVGFIGLIVIGYEAEKEKMDTDVYIPFSLIAVVCGIAWPIVVGLICLFGVCYIPISLGKLMNKTKTKADFKKKLNETPIDKIKKR